MNLENGKTYLLNHSRKGTFMMRIDRQDETWAHGVVVGGKIAAIMPYNKKYVNDPITVRISFLNSAVEQPA